MTTEPCCYGFVTSRGQEHEVDCPLFKYTNHEHHWRPRKVGRNRQGEPINVLACAHCGIKYRTWFLEQEGRR